MSKKNPFPARRETPPAKSNDAEAAVALSRFVVFRETVESIVVAFVLAFLFRTFEAEAFVIPTGSMSPSLQGRHKDVVCTQCGARFRVSASAEDMEDTSRPRQFSTFEEAEVVGGMCPMCRYPMPFNADLPDEAREEVSHLTNLDDVETQYSYPGDRILVNKYRYDFTNPNRWDVVVFKFPGDGEMNYIKRLVGLPGEMLRIYQGDVFTRRLDDPSAPFKIQRKPPAKVAAMLQTVHDTDYEPSALYKGRWPLRWAATTPDGWKVDAVPGELTVKQTFSVDRAAGADVAWLRYRHLAPDRGIDWPMALNIARTGSFADLAKQEGRTEAEMQEAWEQHIRPQLITDFNSYNARIHRLQLTQGVSWSNAMDQYLGRNWVGDLAVEGDIDVQEARGELLLDLVEAGYHFRATVDLKTGDAKLAVIDARTGDALPFEATAKTPLSSAGNHSVRYANVDDQILLWVDNKLVANAPYEPDEIFQAAGGRRGMLPWADVSEGGDQADLTPAGIGAKGAKLAISRLAVLRDVYYIATDDRMPMADMQSDYDLPFAERQIDGERAPRLDDLRDLFARPEAWVWFRTRREKDFPIQSSPAQLFVMGDNSPESADCRLWTRSDGRSVPGGHYLDRRLLIGNAVCVFWPHSWGSIPGLPKLPGFPNFGDMRLVR